MKSIEVEAKTIKEAISLALKELKTTKDKVKVKVLVEEKKGLFGMNGGDLAKVRVTLRSEKGNS